MSNKTQIGSANIKDNLNAKMLSFLANEKTEYTRILYFGQVVINEDSKNSNRIKVRIPLIDNIFYNDVTKEEGDNSLPWCISMSSRFIDTPEINSIVLVALVDPKTPFFGRVYFNSLTELSNSDLFERLTPEEKALSNWLNAENSLEIGVGKPNEEGKFNSKNKTKYKVGIRGRGNNKVELDKEQILISQNYKNRNKESYLLLSENSTLETADKIDIISKKGRNKKYHPVFDETLFDFLDKNIRMFQKIITLLNSIPAIAPIGGPCTAGPTANQLIVELNTLKAELKKLKRNGYSEKITIN